MAVAASQMAEDVVFDAVIQGYNFERMTAVWPDIGSCHSRLPGERPPLSIPEERRWGGDFFNQVTTHQAGITSHPLQQFLRISIPRCNNALHGTRGANVFREGPGVNGLNA